jgi:hypothetical protein
MQSKEGQVRAEVFAPIIAAVLGKEKAGGAEPLKLLLLSRTPTIEEEYRSSRPKVMGVYQQCDESSSPPKDATRSA